MGKICFFKGKGRGRDCEESGKDVGELLLGAVRDHVPREGASNHEVAKLINVLDALDEILECAFGAEVDRTRRSRCPA